MNLEILISLVSLCINIHLTYGYIGPKTTPIYRLNYFASKGRAEFIRWIFVASGISFVDNRISASDWPEIKPTTPFGAVPTLDIFDHTEKHTTLAQSTAMASYLGTLYGLGGKNDLEKAQVDMYGQQINEMFNLVSTPGMQTNLTLRSLMVDELLIKTWPTYMDIFEDRIIENETGYLVGEKLTWADFYLVHLLDYLFEKKRNFLLSYPNINKLDLTVRRIPNIAKWISSRPKTIF